MWPLRVVPRARTNFLYFGGPAPRRGARSCVPSTLAHGHGRDVSRVSSNRNLKIRNSNFTVQTTHRHILYAHSLYIFAYCSLYCYWESIL
jgi:hypothetical protein